MKQWDKQEIEIAGGAKVMHKEDCSKKIIFPKYLVSYGRNESRTMESYSRKFLYD